MTLPFSRYRTWWPGLLTALAGVAGVRVAALLPPSRVLAALSIVGYLLVPVGLALVARQIRRDAAGRSGGP